MNAVSAGLVLYRVRDGELQVLLVHPGGPFWAKKDQGAWSIPKGEVQNGEDLLVRARQELREETGLVVEGPFEELTPVKQSRKVVHAWLVRTDRDDPILPSNTCQIEYPPRSGRMLTIPEVDQARWYGLPIAVQKILPAQLPFLNQLQQRVNL